MKEMLFPLFPVIIWVALIIIKQIAGKSPKNQQDESTALPIDDTEQDEMPVFRTASPKRPAPPKHTTYSMELDDVFAELQKRVVSSQPRKQQPPRATVPQNTPTEENNAAESTVQLVSQSLATAYPLGIKTAKATRPGIHRPTHVTIRGRHNVSQAIIMSEVLARPRAFDL